MHAHCCKAACQSNYLLYLEEDVSEAVANARGLEVGLGAMCADVVGACAEMWLQEEISRD